MQSGSAVDGRPEPFANMMVPEGMEKAGVIQAIRRAHGLAPLYHPDPIWMKSELYWWSRENLPIWKKLFATTQLEYNPIWNTDVSEITKDTTERAKNTAENTATHSHGGADEQSQHADDRHQMETTGNLYHEDTKADGFTTDNAAGQEKRWAVQPGKSMVLLIPRPAQTRPGTQRAPLTGIRPAPGSPPTVKQ